ncbi:hypothetical protein ABEB36_007857 [Hypothenemus hampei]|uniref:PPM-type phosphatase domain-containing protein n=1 Tax=Hypothenemus hampei TaxID=57062 RepID=A0ABD1EVG8_HYPHA
MFSLNILSVVRVSEKKSPKRIEGQPIDNTTMVIKVAGNEYCVTNKPKRHSKSFSLGSISDFNIEVEKTRIDTSYYSYDSKKNDNDDCMQESSKIGIFDEGKSLICPTNKEAENVDEEKRLKLNTFDNRHVKRINNINKTSSGTKNYALSKSTSEGNPFHNKKRGKVIQVQRQQSHMDGAAQSCQGNVAYPPRDDTSMLPTEWNLKSDKCYGISDSLYDLNQVTRHKNGDPIADCFGIIARNDSAILAVADGVNWGEKASVAAKSAVHASLYYLNKTIFNDTKPFEKLTVKTDDVASDDPIYPPHLVGNTRDVFVCLLRAFNCAHDLILENKGMLTTLTVAVVLPLKQLNKGLRSGDQDGRRYVCCVCNVGDTLAYVYSQKNGLRELTKGSHDVTSNRDMRDALGALGPVDGINPELSNLTLSLTTLNKGDIVLVASDGLTDNFDPNVCGFTVNSNKPIVGTGKKPVPVRIESQVQKETVVPPVKPPRRSKTRASVSSSSQSERSSSSVEKEVVSQRNDNYELDPLKAHFLRENSLEETKKSIKKLPSVVETKTSNLRKQVSIQNKHNDNPPSKPHSSKASTAIASREISNTLDSSTSNRQAYNFLKSKTSLDLRSSNRTSKIQILRNEDGIPYISPIQRYELQLLLIEDILRHGLSGREPPITNAKKLCEYLVSFTMSITSAKRRTLEDKDLYFDNRNGILVEVNNQEKKLRRKKGLDKVQTLPGKLDHVTVVAYNVGNMDLG